MIMYFGLQILALREKYGREEERERERVEENRSEGKRRDILYKYDRYLRKFTKNYF